MESANEAVWVCLLFWTSRGGCAALVRMNISALLTISVVSTTPWDSALYWIHEQWNYKVVFILLILTSWLIQGKSFWLDFIWFSEIVILDVFSYTRWQILWYFAVNSHHTVSPRWQQNTENVNFSQLCGWMFNQVPVSFGRQHCKPYCLWRSY